MSRWATVRSYLIPSAVFLGVLLALLWRMWTPLGERREFGIDSQWQYWGDLAFQIDAYRDGELPLWDPYDRGGYPFHRDPQTASLYPVNWAFIGLGLITGSSGFWLINLKQILHLFILCLGMYAFLRRRGLPPPCCYAGGLLLLISSPVFHHFDFNLNWSFAWMPWALLAVEAWAEKPSLARASAVALTLALSFLAGSPPGFWYALLIVVPYGIWALAHYKQPFWRSAAVMAALFLGLVAAQTVATAGLLPDTVRDERDLQFVVGTQFGAADLVGFLIPRLTRLNHYLGVVGLFAVGAALAIKPEPRRLVLAGIAVAGVLFAWGADGQLLAAASSAIPPFRLFRYAMRYTYVAFPALAILAAEGLADLAAQRRRGTIVPFIGALAAAAFLMGFAVQQREARIPYGHAFAAAAVGTWIVYMLVTGENQRRALTVAVVALFVDLWVGHGEAVERSMATRVDTRHDPETKGLRFDERFYDRAYLKFRPGVRLHLRDFGGYEGDPLALKRYAALRDTLIGQLRNLGHANVRTYLEDAPKTLNKSGADLASLKLLRPGVYQVADVAPAILWIDRADVVDDERRAIAALVATRPGTAAILERPTLSPEEIDAAQKGARETPPVAGTLVELTRNHLVATVDAPADGVVVVHEAFFPGWKAWVDGAPARIFPANGMFRGVLVGPGSHRIEMRYGSPLFLVLAGVELLTLLAAIGLCARRT